LYRRLLGITGRVSTTEYDDDDDLLAEQEGKGYGEDEGERDAALDEERETDLDDEEFDGEE
jgi:hypothetical protein